MDQHFRASFLTLLALLLFVGLGRSDVSLSTAGAPYAPLDVSKKQQDPLIPLSASQRQELLVEFKGLVHMGLRKVSYERWEGKGMADCSRPERGEDKWSVKCEIITGQGNGLYYFYPGENRQSATLQQIDVRIHAADTKLLEEFRRPVQELFGRDRPARHWNTGNDVADLFIDHGVRPGGSVRFVWSRTPLVAGAHASLSGGQARLED